MRVAGGLTYTYSLDAVQSYLIAWQHAGHLNRTVRLSDVKPGKHTARSEGQDLGLVQRRHRAVPFGHQQH